MLQKHKVVNEEKLSELLHTGSIFHLFIYCLAEAFYLMWQTIRKNTFKHFWNKVLILWEQTVSMVSFLLLFSVNLWVFLSSCPLCRRADLHPAVFVGDNRCGHRGSAVLCWLHLSEEEASAARPGKSYFNCIVVFYAVGVNKQQEWVWVH